VGINGERKIEEKEKRGLEKRNERKNDEMGIVDDENEEFLKDEGSILYSAASS